MDVMVLGGITVANNAKSPLLLSKALFLTEVKVLGTVIEVPSSERNRRAWALVKTAILEEEGKGRIKEDELAINQRYSNINIEMWII